MLEAEEGEGALEIARKHSGPIHLLLTEVVMPRISGRELAERLALERPDCRALFMSGYSNGAISDRGILLEGTALLEKPFTSERLGSSVREALDTPPSPPEAPLSDEGAPSGSRPGRRCTAGRWSRRPSEVTTGS